MNIIVLKLNEIIAERGILKSVLASKIGITKESLYNILGRNSSMSVDNLKKIAFALDVPISYFFEEDTPQSTMKRSENDNQNTLSHKIVKYQQKIELLTIENKGLKKEIESQNKIISLLETALKS